MNIYLIRHGDKVCEMGDPYQVELNSKGIKQANLLGQRLKKYGIEKIYSSDMLRAIQTANEINKYLNIEIVVRSGLKEIDMGECERKGWDYVKKNYPDFMAAFKKHEIDICYPGGECGEDVWIRSKAVVEEIINTGLKNVAVVTHGGAIRALLSGALGIAQEKRFYFGEPLENCSISILKFNSEEGKFHIHCVNDYSHLEDLDI